MIISNVSKEQLEEALAEVSAMYDGNVIWNRAPEALNQKENRFRLTLRVKDSSGAGARRSWRGRRMVAACWHVHGEFFDALPEGAVIRVAGQEPKSPGDPWKDVQIGSLWYPAYMSEACEC